MSLNGSLAKLKDDTVLEIDTILFCTGYHYKFPFFKEDMNLVSVDTAQYVSPLFKHLIHTKYPSLSIIGIPKIIVPFPLFDCQIQFVRSVLSGQTQLPSEPEMYADAKQDFEQRLAAGYPPRYAHYLLHKQWPYNDYLADMGHFKRIPRVVMLLFNDLWEARLQDLFGYKSKEYRIIDDERYETLGD